MRTIIIYQSEINDSQGVNDAIFNAKTAEVT